MSEERQVKTFYRPRVQIPVEWMFNETAEYAMVCLPRDGISALLALIAYAKRRITYIDEVIDVKSFWTPDADTMSAILDIIEETEVNLMTACDIESIVTAIEAQTTVLEGLSACVCASAATQSQNSGRLPPLDGYVDQELATYKNTNDVLGDYVDPETSEETCKDAQAIFWYTYTMFSEEIMPYASETADKITAAIIAASTFGAIATFVGIPVAVLASVVGAVINWGVQGSIETFLNWLFASKDEIVCILYHTMYDIDDAAAAVANYIDDAETISFLDKAVLKTVLASPWHYSMVIADQQQNGTWDTFIEEGFCATCVPDLYWYWSGTPCADAELIGSCGANDTVFVNVANDVDTPAFEITEGGTYQFVTRLRGASVNGTLKLILWKDDPLTVVADWEVSLAIGEDRIFTKTRSLGLNTWHLEWTNVGASDGDIVWVAVTKI